MTMAPSAVTVLLLPGWQNSGPAHWQSRWEALHGDRRVEQHEWVRPLRGDWSIRLEEEVLAAPSPVVLVAHSLGCLLVAAWAAHSRQTGRVRAALLVAPADLERDDLRQTIPGWAPIVRQRLPFPTLMIAAADDPYCSAARSRQLAADWGARFVDAADIRYASLASGEGAAGTHAGHLNHDSGLGDWPEGRALLNDFLKEH
jgi:predicted alpha/beta hydrolase family esterase